MSGLKRQGIRQLALLPIAGLVSLGYLSAAGAAPTTQRASAPVDASASPGQRDERNVHLRLERLEEAVRQLKSQSGGSSQIDQKIQALEQELTALTQQINALESDVGELQALSVPADIDVNCGAGQNISAVLATYANGRAPLTIRISGTCNEAVAIHRSNVALIGESGAAIQTPADAYGVTIDDGAANVSISGLSILGGAGAAFVSKGARAEFTNVNAQGSRYGIVSSDNAVVDVAASTLKGNALYGAYAVRSGVVNIKASTVQGNLAYGVYSYRGGVVALSGTTVTGNAVGAGSRAGGVLEVSSSSVVNNTNEGVIVFKSSSVAFIDGANTITGNSYGVYCHANAGYATATGSPGVTSPNRFAGVSYCN
ncbi:MAG TPA: right-handed parallel beta-helix repeat-containing protein [Steroidobacter sp.]|jgi:hypothetical protein|nr:right-handed parallel beta-helix repeat-containing protein [Steroidobacter sp.]